MEYINTSASLSNDSEEYGEYLWGMVLSNLKNIIKAEQFDTWFKKVEFHKLENSTIIIAVKSNFVREWIINNYFLTIKKELLKLIQQSLLKNLALMEVK